MLISEAKFRQIFPNAITGIYGEIAKQIAAAGCTTKPQQAMFLAQCGHETAGFSVMSENLNYSAERLLSVFPKYFSPQNVVLYARDKVKIANRVYANRLGNGNEQSGDGWKYRGRGIIQVTGKANYQAFAAWVGDSELLSNPDRLLRSEALMVATAVWFWQANRLADYRDVLTVTRKINGGTHGLRERESYYKRLMA